MRDEKSCYKHPPWNPIVLFSKKIVALIVQILCTVMDPNLSPQYNHNSYWSVIYKTGLTINVRAVLQVPRDKMSPLTILYTIVREIILYRGSCNSLIMIDLSVCCQLLQFSCISSSLSPVMSDYGKIWLNYSQMTSQKHPLLLFYIIVHKDDAGCSIAPSPRQKLNILLK